MCGGERGNAGGILFLSNNLKSIYTRLLHTHNRVRGQALMVNFDLRRVVTVSVWGLVLLCVCRPESSARRIIFRHHDRQTLIRTLARATKHMFSPCCKAASLHTRHENNAHGNSASLHVVVCTSNGYRFNARVWTHARLRPKLTVPPSLSPVPPAPAAPMPALLPSAPAPAPVAVSLGAALLRIRPQFWRLRTQQVSTTLLARQ